MNFKKTGLPGVFIVETPSFEDHRGFFMEVYQKHKFHNAGLSANFIQDNHSFSKDAGVIRGLHYQLNPKAQTKLVRAATGVIIDIAVDIRKGSPTFSKWISVILSEYNKRQLYIPKGFAHGFCTLTTNTNVIYKVDEQYSPELDRGIAWDDPDIGIEWPITHPILSSKDKKHPLLKEVENDFS
ncbi:dTDP-4-dehydrorhamnose 3,5-epimerase [Chengkuizengella axinellae]|uniref:dTDP-4-dehydrorhamnose 3,5-epimerase n=1 Tax=Chengkuizengella axinellae TaxID=3064388 RepID=A0ABT9J254_9BACL|nr:dTDP-4-dehydrorhamnose 3,5-epimerase [Chengkuizengella sp. 2205SS18-9]MDP5275507.1 dTDP-4-dehydrorhamnose 3,5-epimerase [Chengkuizengella sp. 2205SS18-9]